MEPIISFREEYRFLSNFWPTVIEYKGIIYRTVEAAFQAAKTDDEKIKREISLLSPNKAKRYSKTITLKPEWDIDKLSIMEELLRLKFVGGLALLLRATGNADLIEGNTWHDNFWGMCVCPACVDKKKHNMLGKLLMKIRADLQQ